MCKRRKLSSSPPPAAQQEIIHGHGHGDEPNNNKKKKEEEQVLLPGLPDHLAHLCLSSLPPRLLYAISRSTRRLLYSHPFLSLYALLHDGDGRLGLASFDPLSQEWRQLPPPPLPNPPPLLTHPCFLSRRLPFQSVAAGGRLVLLAASTSSLSPAFPRPLLFHPTSSRWSLGPEFPLSPRRWCAAGPAGTRVFLAAGVGASHDAAVARSAAMWDVRGGEWARLPELRDGRFSREAVEAVASGNNKVCMVSVRGRGAKDGAVYDLTSSRWEEMPPGMLSGWTGPAAAMASSGDMYVVGEETGAVSTYDWGKDRWMTVVEANEKLAGAAEVAAGGGMVCVVTAGGQEIVVVSPASGKMWSVAPPPGKRVQAVHVLPRPL